LKAGSTANQASYPMNSGGYFQVDKAAELWSWQLYACCS
jgi:hypothetical protein